jgi:hypothetical protein
MVGVSMPLAERRFVRPLVRPRNVLAIGGPLDQPLAMRLHNLLVDLHGDDYLLDWKCAAIRVKEMPPTDINPHDVDCLVLLGKHSALNRDGLEKIYDYWQCGGSLLAIRVAEFAQRGEAELASEIFGGQYRFEHSLQPVEIKPAPHAAGHPLLRGVQPFVARGGLQRYELYAGEATTIAAASAAGQTIPVAWVRQRLGRRVFATTLGAAADFRHPCFLRLLANAVLWTAR